MEPVKDNTSVLGPAADNPDVRLPHVHADCFQLAKPLRTQLPEEPAQDLDLASFPGPNDPATLVVHDQGDVLVSAAIADLIDTDQAQTVQASFVQGLVDDPADDPMHRAPGDPEIAGHGRQVGFLSQPGNLPLEGIGESAPVGRPGHRLGRGAAMPADEAGDASSQKCLHPPQIQMPPMANGIVLDSQQWTGTASTSPGPLSADHVDDQVASLALDLGTADPEALQAKRTVQ